MRRRRLRLRSEVGRWAVRRQGSHRRSGCRVRRRRFSLRSTAARWRSRRSHRRRGTARRRSGLCLRERVRGRCGGDVGREAGRSRHGPRGGCRRGARERCDRYRCGDARSGRYSGIGHRRWHGRARRGRVLRRGFIRWWRDRRRRRDSVARRRRGRPRSSRRRCWRARYPDRACGRGGACLRRRRSGFFRRVADCGRDRRARRRGRACLRRTRRRRRCRCRVRRSPDSGRDCRGRASKYGRACLRRSCRRSRCRVRRSRDCGRDRRARACRRGAACLRRSRGGAVRRSRDCRWDRRARACSGSRPCLRRSRRSRRHCSFVRRACRRNIRRPCLRNHCPRRSVCLQCLHALAGVRHRIALRCFGCRNSRMRLRVVARYIAPATRERRTRRVGMALRSRNAVADRSRCADRLRRRDARVLLRIKVRARRRARDDAAHQHREHLARGPSRRGGRLVARLDEARIRRHHLSTREPRKPAGVAKIDDAVHLLDGRNGCRVGDAREDRAVAIRAAVRAGKLAGRRNGVAAAANDGVKRQRRFGLRHGALVRVMARATREARSRQRCIHCNRKPIARGRVPS